jgi:hypothetical protein
VNKTRWLAAGELDVGDLFLSHDNLRVADFHASFVGAREWGFVVWANNIYNDLDTSLPATGQRANQIRNNIYARLRRAGVPQEEASMLASLGREDLANGQVLVDALDNGIFRRLSGSGVSAQERMNGVGDVIRRMTQQNSGILWDRAVAIEPSSFGSLHGDVFEIPLSTGQTSRAFRGSDGQVYFCHGLSTGGVEAVGGRFSPRVEVDQGMGTIRDNLYDRVRQADARPGDLVLWAEEFGEIPHSAVLTHVGMDSQSPSFFDSSRTRVQTKNGGFVPEANMTLGDVMWGQRTLRPSAFPPGGRVTDASSRCIGGTALDRLTRSFWE